MTIVTHLAVRAAFERALQLDPTDHDAAMHAAAAALCVPVEAVQHVVATTEDAS
jgi:hypothetical protein